MVDKGSSQTVQKRTRYGALGGGDGPGTGRESEETGQMG